VRLRHHHNDQQRVKLIATEVALEMINRGLREDLMLIRKLPEMVQTSLVKPSPRRSLAILDAMKHGSNAAMAMPRCTGTRGYGRVIKVAGDLLHWRPRWFIC
jgi:hypothetical protein